MKLHILNGQNALKISSLNRNNFNFGHFTSFRTMKNFKGKEFWEVFITDEIKNM